MEEEFPLWESQLKRGTTMSRKSSITNLRAKELRKRLGMNQSEFWGEIGVTQSGGSRYEGRRGVPLTVALLVHLYYVAKKVSPREMKAALRAVKKQ